MRREEWEIKKRRIESRQVKLIDNLAFSGVSEVMFLRAGIRPRHQSFHPSFIFNLSSVLFVLRSSIAIFSIPFFLSFIDSPPDGLPTGCLSLSVLHLPDLLHFYVTPSYWHWHHSGFDWQWSYLPGLIQWLGID